MCAVWSKFNPLVVKLEWRFLGSGICRPYSVQTTCSPPLSHTDRIQKNYISGQFDCRSCLKLVNVKQPTTFGASLWIFCLDLLQYRKTWSGSKNISRVLNAKLRYLAEWCLCKYHDQPLFVFLVKSHTPCFFFSWPIRLMDTDSALLVTVFLLKWHHPTAWRHHF